MTLFEIIIIGIGLASDAFAAAVCKGLSLKEKNRKNSITIALYFAFFQSIMPIIGYVIGFRYEHLVSHIDHWIIFVLLVIIGFNMLAESQQSKIEKYKTELERKELISLSIATSIDAFAVGITFAFLKVHLLKSCMIIGIITFILCYIGTNIGSKLGQKYKNKAEMFGGMMLIIIGIKILLEHIL